MNKFIFDNAQTNLWKFINIYQKYLMKNLNANEYFNFNLIFENSGKPKDLNQLILDYQFINQFIDLWENHFIYYY